MIYFSNTPVLSDFRTFPDNATAGVRAHIILVFMISGNQSVCLTCNIRPRVCDTE